MHKSTQGSERRKRRREEEEKKVVATGDLITSFMFA
jgi:hypothetical protein